MEFEKNLQSIHTCKCMELHGEGALWWSLEVNCSLGMGCSTEGTFVPFISSSVADGPVVVFCCFLRLPLLQKVFLPARFLLYCE